MNPSLSRRQVLTLTAAAATVGLGAALGLRPAPRPVRWSGQIMGATASITLYDRDAEHAKAIIRTCLDEVERLEGIFSLLRPDSDVSRLNRKGRLDGVTSEMKEVLARANHISAVSAGAFDVSVQALWTLYSTHFARAGMDADGPPQDAVAAAQATIGWQDIDMNGDAIRLGKPGQGLTFNSIARGYATDRVGRIMRDHGMDHVLIDLDNYLGIGPRPDGRPWALGMADPRDPKSILRVLETKDRAVASAGGYGTVFDRTGRFHHIFDPHTGGCANRWAGATVVAQSATVADALSTALLVAPKEQTARLLAEAGGERAYLVDFDGRVTVL
jgi:thiamine biosynthesis lipoprotein